MDWSKHARKRALQRGIPYFFADLIYQYGDLVHHGNGCSKYKMSKKSTKSLEIELKKIIQYLDKINGRTIVVAEDGLNVITAY